MVTKNIQVTEMNQVCHLALKNILCCVPRYCKSQCYSQYMPTCFLNLNNFGLAIRNSTPTHLVWLQRDHWYRKYRTDKHSVSLTFAVTLILNTVIHSFYKTLWLMMKYHHLSLVAQGSPVQQIWSKTSYFDYITPHCHYDLENSTAIFLHNSMSHSDVPPYRVWLQKDQQFRKQ